MADLTTVYSTKYVLTAGIEKITGELSGNTFSYKQEESFWTTYLHGEGRDWHRTEESARKRAEEIRLKKIASLKKQIAKLELLTFSV